MIELVLAGMLIAVAPASGASSDASVASETGLGGASGMSPVVIDLSAYSVSATTVLSTMHRVSLDPASVAAAGVSLNESVAMLTAAAASLEANAQSLAAADDAVGTARTNVDALERSIRAGQVQDTQAAVAALNTARGTLASAMTALEAVLATIIDAATASLSNAQKTPLATIRASAATWGELPSAYRVIASDDAALLALRGALAAKRIALDAQETVPDDAAAILSTWTQTPAISTAIAAQDANAAMIDAAWATAVQPVNP